MTKVERAWFRIRAAGLALPALYCPERDRDGDFDNVADADPPAGLGDLHRRVPGR
jgi:hypothetical protein